MTKTILMRRSGALGDVILTTPVLRRLRRENPEAHIAVHTAYPDVFSGSVHLSSMNEPVSSPDLVVDLDLAYEKRPRMHIVEAYMQEAFGDPGHAGDMRQELFFQPFKHRLEKSIAIHAAVAGWRNRTFPRTMWEQIARRLTELGFSLYLVGTSRDDQGLKSVHGISYPHAFMFDLQTQTALIDACDCFIGSDSALLHAAGATSTPIVGLFSCALPNRRMPLECPAPQRALVAENLSCIGCLHRRPPPVTTEFCERGDSACVDGISAERVVEAVTALINENRRQTGF